MRLLFALVVALATTYSAPAASLLEAVPTESGPRDVVCEAVEIVLPDQNGEPDAVMHAYSYSVDDDTDRPVTFLWNGGPGASAALLHTSFAGPVTAPVESDRARTLAYNPHTLIDLTDLVFVDPVGTGLSRAIPEGDASDFWGVTEDAKAAALFVSAYLRQREASSRPVYLCGESYGAVRVAAMLAPLDDAGIHPEGLILISPALESRTLRPKARSASARTARADTLPTYAAISLATGARTSDDARAFIEDACEFAHGPYLEALRAPERPTGEALELLTTLRDRFTDRPDTDDRDQHDARFPQSGDAMNGIEVDELGAALSHLLRRAHTIETNGRYVLLNRQANMRWRSPSGRRGLSRSDIRATRMIADAAEAGRATRVFIAGGWYDLVTPFAISRRLAREGAFGDADITVTDYPAGHVIYADHDAHDDLAHDLREWWNSL